MILKLSFIGGSLPHLPRSGGPLPQQFIDREVRQGSQEQRRNGSGDWDPKVDRSGGSFHYDLHLVNVGLYIP